MNLSLVISSRWQIRRLLNWWPSIGRHGWHRRVRVAIGRVVVGRRRWIIIRLTVLPVHAKLYYYGQYVYVAT
jgi:hypothetical protein